MIKRLTKIGQWLDNLEKLVLVCILLTMILTAVMQIVLRNVFSGGMVWAEGLVQACVLWTALLGAMRAAKFDKHIAIDVLLRFSKPQWKKPLQVFIYLLSASACLFTAYYALQFVQLEYEGGATLFADIPAWVIQSIIPFTLTVMGWRFLLLSIKTVTNRETP